MLARKWRLFKARSRLYAVTGDGLLAHRYVLGVGRNTLVDHLNDDGLDCRRANLSLITKSQAAARAWSRAVLSHVPTSRYRGVSYVAGRVKPWKAAISVASHQRFLGYFQAEEEAAKAYDVEALAHFGRYAHLNFPVTT